MNKLTRGRFVPGAGLVLYTTGAVGKVARPRLKRCRAERFVGGGRGRTARASHPAWTRNLIAHPECEILVRGKTTPQRPRCSRATPASGWQRPSLSVAGRVYGHHRSSVPIFGRLPLGRRSHEADGFVVLERCDQARQDAGEDLDLVGLSRSMNALHGLDMAGAGFNSCPAVVSSTHQTRASVSHGPGR